MEIMLNNCFELRKLVKYFSKNSSFNSFCSYFKFYLTFSSQLYKLFSNLENPHSPTQHLAKQATMGHNNSKAEQQQKNVAYSQLALSSCENRVINVRIIEKSDKKQKEEG